MAVELVVLCGSAPDQSAVEVIATRWAHTFNGESVVFALDCNGPKLAEGPVVRGDLSDHLKSIPRFMDDGAFFISAGLPKSNHDAQLVIDLIGKWPSRSAILWERPGFAIPEVAQGLEGLDFVALAMTLAQVHEESIRHQLPSATVSTIGAGIPEVFFAESLKERSSSIPHAAFFGRAHPSKGTQTLVDVWSAEVFPRTHLPLRLYVIDPHELVATSMHGIEVDRIPDLSGRARAMRNAECVIFPARYDHLPQAMLETAAAGGLIVATPIDGHSFVVDEETGLSLRGSELTSLVETVNRILLDGDALRRVRKRASDAVRTQHSAELASQQLRRIVAATQ